MARWRSGNAGVCKTPMRRFNSGTRLNFHHSPSINSFRFNSYSDSEIHHSAVNVPILRGKLCCRFLPGIPACASNYLLLSRSGVCVNVYMARSSMMRFTGKDLFLALSMLAITAIVLIYGNRSTYHRSEAYTRTATGIRIEAEEMSLSGSAAKDGSGTFVQF